MNPLTVSRLPLRAAGVAATLFSLFGAVSAAHAQYVESFDAVPNGQNAPNFGNDTGGWAVNNPTGTSGAYSSNRQNLFNFSTLTAPGFTSLSDVNFTFDLIDAADSGALLHSDAAGQNAVVVIVRPSVGDFYFIPRSSGGFGGVVGGTGSASLAGRVAVGDDLRVTFSASGNTFTASVASLANPSVALQSISHTFAPGAVATSGRVGFYQYGNASVASSFDNLNVTASVAAPEPGTLPLAAATLLLGGAGLVGSAAASGRRRRTATPRA